MKDCVFFFFFFFGNLGGSFFLGGRKLGFGCCVPGSDVGAKPDSLSGLVILVCRSNY